MPYEGIPGFDRKLFSGLKDAGNDTGLRVAADEWFAHHKKESPVLPSNTM
jgi:hypothetical protein